MGIEMGLETNEIYFILSMLFLLGLFLILGRIADKQKQNKNKNNLKHNKDFHRSTFLEVIYKNWVPQI